MARPIRAALDALGWHDRHDRVRLRRAQQASLARAWFEDEDGNRRPGSSLRVLRAGRPLADCLEEEDLAAAFWYCEAQDGALFLAIPVDYRVWHGWRVEWVIRPALQSTVDLQQQAWALSSR